MKVLYNTESQAVSAYPRSDDEPVVGLDPIYLVLVKIETPAPSPTAVPTWEVDLDALEYRQSWTESEPPPPEPDWLSFNLTLIPPAPGTQTSFEMWLEQFKIQHQSPLVNAAGLGNLEETQRLYDSLKAISEDSSTPQAQPTPEQITEWQNIADRHNIGLTF